jgi:hypothetical protein
MTKEKGYKVITRDEETEKLRNEFKIPMGCYACGKLMENWDSNFFYRHGTCSECYINYIEGRDLSKELLEDRSELIKYIKCKVEEKNKNLSKNE